MQIDFHYYAIYTLCCLAGMEHEYSKKVAYASQHTDDAKYNHELLFKSGGRFKQAMSAHKFLDPSIFDKAVGYDIFLPFHFLPGVEGQEFYDKLICREKSITAQEMLEDTIRTLDKPYGLYRLGIALHVYADTWSHQNFHGLQKDHNTVSNLIAVNRRRDIREVISGILPKIGHGQALEYPDEPYLIWSYDDFNNNRININNPERFLDAAYHIYAFMTQKVRSVTPQYFIRDASDWPDIEDLFKDVFSFEGDIEERVKNWQTKLWEHYFGFKSDIKYDDREWFKKAVDVTSGFIGGEISDSYDKKPGFEQSDWKYFHDALIYHSFFIKHELLPKYGIIT